MQSEERIDALVQKCLFVPAFSSNLHFTVYGEVLYRLVAGVPAFAMDCHRRDGLVERGVEVSELGYVVCARALEVLEFANAGKSWTKTP